MHDSSMRKDRYNRLLYREIFIAFIWHLSNDFTLHHSDKAQCMTAQCVRTDLDIRTDLDTYGLLYREIVIAFIRQLICYFTLHRSDKLHERCNSIDPHLMRCCVYY